MQHLLDSGAHVNATTKNGRSALICAVISGHARVVEALVKYGASLAHPFISGNLALYVAISNGSADIVAHILSSPCLDIDRGLSHARGMASLRETLEICGVAYCADWKKVCAPPLCQAANEGSPQIIGMLLRKGAYANATDSDGATALCIACRAGRREVVSALLRGGAWVNGDLTSGVIPLEEAIKANDAAIVKMLLDAGADRELGNPLAVAVCTHPGREIVDLLLRAGADKNAGVDPRVTPLQLAMAKGYIPASVALAEAGASVHEDFEDSLEVGEEMRRIILPIVALRQVVFLFGTHPRMGKGSPIQLFAGFGWITDFIISRSLPGWLIPSSKKDNMPELM